MVEQMPSPLLTRRTSDESQALMLKNSWTSWSMPWRLNLSHNRNPRQNTEAPVQQEAAAEKQPVRKDQVLKTANAFGVISPGILSSSARTTKRTVRSMANHHGIKASCGASSSSSPRDGSDRLISSIMLPFNIIDDFVTK